MVQSGVVLRQLVRYEAMLRLSQHATFRWAVRLVQFMTDLVASGSNVDDEDRGEARSEGMNSKADRIDFRVLDMLENCPVVERSTVDSKYGEL